MTSTLSPSFTPIGSSTPGQVAHSQLYNGSDTLWVWNTIAQCMFLGIGGIMFFLRTYVTLWVQRQWTKEDWFSLFCWISLVINGAITTKLVLSQGGTHIWNTEPTPADKIQTLYWAYISQVWYSVAIAAFKVAVLIMYLRIFSPQSRSKLAIFIYGLIVVLVLFYFSLTMVKILRCVPRTKIWNPYIKGKCLSNTGIFIVGSSFNIVSDFVIMLVPVKVLWRMQMRLSRKLGVLAIFTVGIIAPIFSILGFVRRLQIGQRNDRTYDFEVLTIWANAEVAIGMVIICMPSLPGLLRRRVQRPSESIINGDRNHSYVVHSKIITKKPSNVTSASTRDDHESVNDSYLEMEDRDGTIRSERLA